MSYTELFPALLAKGHVQTKTPPVIPNKPPFWFRADQFCAYHEGAPGHNIENCVSLKSDVQRQVKNMILSFKDTNPNGLLNPLPQHGESTVNMAYGCPDDDDEIHDVRLLGENLVKLHARQSGFGHIPSHDYHQCKVCSKSNQGCSVVQAAIQDQMNQGWIRHYRNRDNL